VSKKSRALIATICAIVALLLVGGEVLARFACRRISRADEFSSLFVGQPPIVTPQALDLNLITSLPGGARRSRSLVSDASPAGQLYGLCGLYFVDRNAFENAKQAFSHRAESVDQLVGCVAIKGSLHAVVFPDGRAFFEDSCLSLKLTFGEWLRAAFGRLRPR
jgi:hypothetical protein